MDLYRHAIEQSGLGRLKAEYLPENRPNQKSALKEQVTAIESQLKELMADAAAPGQALDWRIRFAEVFLNGGFDVVIGNPPYVESRNSSVSKALKEGYRNQVLRDWSETLPRGSDLLIYFYPRSVKLLKEAGYGCFITQNAWLSTDYGQKFQQFSVGRFSFLKIIDTTARFFTNVESQNINAVITVFRKAAAEGIEYCLADGDMNIAPRGTIPANGPTKWGHAIAMPQSMAGILSRMSGLAHSESLVSFGQGLNFPKRELNQPGASIGVIVKDARFVSSVADGRIGKVSAARKSKIPALIMPRGLGSRFYCTFNSCKAFSYSAVELYLPAELWESEIHYCLWAYMNSSFVWLYREVTGRRNLGGGMLKAEASDMKGLPVNFDFDFADEARDVFETIKHREPLPVSEEVYTEDHLSIDEMVANFFGFSDEQESIRQSLIGQVNFRVSRSRSRS